MPGCGPGCEITFSPPGPCLVVGYPWPHIALLASALPGNRCCQQRGDTPRPGYACREALEGSFEVGTCGPRSQSLCRSFPILSFPRGWGRPGPAWAHSALRFSSWALGCLAPSVLVGCLRAWLGITIIGCRPAPVSPPSLTTTVIGVDCQTWPHRRRQKSRTMNYGVDLGSELKEAAPEDAVLSQVLLC